MELSTGQIMPSYAKPSNQGVRERFFTDMIKTLKMRSSWITWIAPNSDDKYLPKRPLRRSQHKRKGKVNCEAEIRVMWSQTQEYRKPLETGGRENTFFRTFGGKNSRLTPHFQVSRLHLVLLELIIVL